VLAEVREYWKGPFHLRFDLIVANITNDKLWIREGIVSGFPNNKPPQFDLSSGNLHVVQPCNKREDIQEPTIREAHIPPEKYYPEGYHPVLLAEWPVDGDIQANLELLPEEFKASVGENYNRKKRLEKAQEDKDNK
jgi:ribonuclease Z